MADSDRSGSLSGLTEQEAKEFHRIFIVSFVIFMLIALVAHLLALEWRPWPAPSTASLLLDGTKDVINIARTMVA